MAQSVMACALGDPANARARPSSLIKRDKDYQRIFSTEYPLELYYVCPIIVRSVEEVLRNSGNLEFRDHLNNIKFYVATLLVLGKIGTDSPSMEQVASIDRSSISAKEILRIATETFDEYCLLGKTDAVAKGNLLLDRLIARCSPSTVSVTRDLKG